MKKLLLVLALSATSGICAMEARTFDTFKEEVGAAAREDRLGQFLQSSRTLRDDAKLFGPEIVAQAQELLAQGDNALLDELVTYEALLKVLVEVTEWVDKIADLSRGNLIVLENKIGDLRYQVKSRPQREAQALEQERLRAEDQAEVQRVKQLLIDAYASGGERKAEEELNAFFQEPLGKAPEGMSAEDWQRFGILKSPGFKINEFANKIKNDVLQHVAFIMANPGEATIESINTTLALLVPLKQDSYMYPKANLHMFELNELKRQKQRAGN